MGTHNILQLFLWQALECAEISSPIIEPIKNPLQTHNFFLLGSQKKIAKFYGDVTLVKIGSQGKLNIFVSIVQAEDPKLKRFIAVCCSAP
jgi:hypothetical protein